MYVNRGEISKVCGVTGIRQVYIFRTLGTDLGETGVAAVRFVFFAFFPIRVLWASGKVLLMLYA